MVLQHTPQVDTNIQLMNHEYVPHRLTNIMGEQGILLGFTDDVWNVNAVRYVLWLQRHSFKLATYGIASALIIPNQPFELNGFYMSIPRTIPFPLLADPDARTSTDFHMEHSGYLLLGRDGHVWGRWYINDTASMSVRSVLYHLRREQ